MNVDKTTGATNHRWGRLFCRAVLWVLAVVAVDVHAQSGPQSPALTPCDSSTRSVSNCKGDAAVRGLEEMPEEAPDRPPALGHDDLDDRPLQIETMNQQLRMEKRRKDSLLRLYPDEAAHNAARLHDLEETDRPIRAAEERIENLSRERRRIAEATGLYAGKPLPADLENQAQRVDTALQQARATLKNCRDQRALVGKTYDDELIVLRRLWAAQRKS